jgi:hypothetical protein
MKIVILIGFGFKHFKSICKLIGRTENRFCQQRKKYLPREKDG